MAAPSQFGAATVPGLNPVTAQMPSFALQSLQAQRQAQIAQALLNEGSAPIDYDNRGRISWTQGLAKMLQAYQGSKLGNDAIKQQAALQTQGMQAMAPMYGFGAPADPQVAAQAAMGAGAKQGSVGPTNSNAALAAALQPQGQAQQPQTGPLNPFGAPPMLAWQASQGDPAALEQLKTFGSNATLTPEIKNNQWSGITPEQAKAMALAEATKKGFQSFTPGESWTNTFTGQGGFAPKLPENTQPNAPFTPGSPIPSVGVVPGAQPAMTGNALASATGTTAGTPHTVTNPDGSSTVGLGGNVFQISPAQQAREDAESVRIMRQERANPNNTPETNAGLDREIARMNGGRTVTGPSATDAAIQKASSDALTALPGQVMQSKQAVTGLESALDVLQGVKATGPGTAKAVNWGALLNNFGIPLGKNNVENYQLAQKYLANSLNTAAAGTGASGSDARFESFSHGQPNPDTMDKAPLESAMRYVLSQHDANIARGDFIAKAYAQAKQAGDPNAAQTAQQRWSQTYNPQYFSFNRMSPSEQAQFLKSQGAKARDWVQGYNNYAAQTGWVH